MTAVPIFRRNGAADGRPDGTAGEKSRSESYTRDFRSAPFCSDRLFQNQ